MSDFYSKYLDLINKEKQNYRGSGIFFYRKDHINDDFDFLLGVDNKKSGNRLSVFGGGKDKDDPNSLYTAVREVFEELFNILPNGVDIVVDQLQKKIDDGSIIEKVFVKKQNEISYFANMDVLNIFINHLQYHEADWTFRGKKEWSKYYNNLDLFIKDRVLKPTQIANNGLNEIKKIHLVKWSELSKPIKRNEERIVIINNIKYKLRDNLNRYLKENIIIDTINKNIH
jgi:hypothetical protein